MRSAKRLQPACLFNRPSGQGLEAWLPMAASGLYLGAEMLNALYLISHPPPCMHSLKLLIPHCLALRSAGTSGTEPPAVASSAEDSQST